MALGPGHAPPTVEPEHVLVLVFTHMPWVPLELQLMASCLGAQTSFQITEAPLLPTKRGFDTRCVPGMPEQKLLRESGTATHWPCPSISAQKVGAVPARSPQNPAQEFEQKPKSDPWS